MLDVVLLATQVLVHEAVGKSDALLKLQGAQPLLESGNLRNIAYPVLVSLLELHTHLLEEVGEESHVEDLLVSIEHGSGGLYEVEEALQIRRGGEGTDGNEIRRIVEGNEPYQLQPIGSLQHLDEGLVHRKERVGHQSLDLEVDLVVLPGVHHEGQATRVRRI